MSSAAPARASGQRSLLAAETLAKLDNREWGCLLIMGPTGSGKTCTLKELSRRYGLPWPQSHALSFDPTRAVVSQLGCSPSEALQLMSESGVNTVPTWLTPMCHLSGGEKARIEAAVSLRRGGRVVDDLGCKLDAQAARMASVAVQRTIARLGLRNVIVATSTPELVPWLQPDWVLHLDPSGFQRLVKNPLPPDKRRPQIELRWEKADDPGAPSAPAADARLRPAQAGMLGKQLEVRCRVVTDDFTKHASAAVEHGFDGCVNNVFAHPPRLDPHNKMGCIVGPSGSGKSVTLKRLTGDPEATMIWDVSILHDVTGLAGEQAARARLHAVGLARHTFERSYEELSNGEQELARLARALLPFDTGDDGAVAFDEAFSCLDPNTALRCASGLARFVRDAGNRGARTRLILAGAALGAADVLARLQPDWVFDPSAASFRTFSGARRVVEASPLLPPPPWDYPALLFKQQVWHGTIRHCNSGYHVWERFKQWQYLSAAFPTNASRHVYLLRGPLNELVGFAAFGAYCGKQKIGAGKLWQEKRLVIDPAFQSLGLGPALSLKVGLHACCCSGDDQLARYSYVTGNAALGRHRSASTQWVETSGNGKKSSGGAIGLKNKPIYIQYCHAIDEEVARQEFAKRKRRLSASAESLHSPRGGASATPAQRPTIHTPALKPVAAAAAPATLSLEEMREARLRRFSDAGAAPSSPQNADVIIIDWGGL